MITAADRPIGIFDSGLGGLTVLKEIVSLLPNEGTVYFGDSGRAPYGTKSAETVIKFSRQNVRFLLSRQVKMIVIACNTASACAYEAVRQEAGVPVVEVISPGASAAVQATKNGLIGVIATRGTIDSEVYVRSIKAAAAGNIRVFQKACPLFVGLAEEGWWDHPVTRLAAREYLGSLREDQVDTLVLGCTHYPLLRQVIADIMGPQVELINAGSKVAAKVKQILASEDLLAEEGRADEQVLREFYTSDSVSLFRRLGSDFLGMPIPSVQRIDIERY